MREITGYGKKQVFKQSSDSDQTVADDLNVFYARFEKPDPVDQLGLALETTINDPGGVDHDQLSLFTVGEVVSVFKRLQPR